MDDYWSETLRCPNCRKTGKVSLTMTDREEIPTVNSIEDGFKVVQTKHGPIFHCGTCDVPARP
jgi:hypothetical protein